MIICWFANLFRMLFGAPAQPCTKLRRPVVQLPRFEPQKYKAITGALVRVEGMRLQPFEFGAALLKIENTGALPQGSEYPSDIPKKSDEELMKMVAEHMPGSIGSESGKTELELRSLRKMTAFAASTEKSGRRMEFAAWVILAATFAQLVIVAVQIVRHH